MNHITIKLRDFQFLCFLFLFICALYGPLMLTQDHVLSMTHAQGHVTAKWYGAMIEAPIFRPITIMLFHARLWLNGFHHHVLFLSGLCVFFAATLVVWYFFRMCSISRSTSLLFCLLFVADMRVRSDISKLDCAGVLCLSFGLLALLVVSRRPVTAAGLFLCSMLSKEYGVFMVLPFGFCLVRLSGLSWARRFGLLFAPIAIFGALYLGLCINSFWSVDEPSLIRVGFQRGGPVGFADVRIPITSALVTYLLNVLSAFLGSVYPPVVEASPFVEKCFVNPFSWSFIGPFDCAFLLGLALYAFCMERKKMAVALWLLIAGSFSHFMFYKANASYIEFIGFYVLAGRGLDLRQSVYVEAIMWCFLVRRTLIFAESVAMMVTTLAS